MTAAKTEMEGVTFIEISDLDQPVYRIFPCHRLSEMFSERELVMVRPSSWDDPFENFLLQCGVIDGCGKVTSLASLRDHWYGLCWTTNEDSDAMWRIYSPDKKGVRVKTTIRKLADTLRERGDRFSYQKHFIGEVEYDTRKNIESFLKNTSFLANSSGGLQTNFAKTLLTKRMEFDHEKEIRILAHENTPKTNHRADGNLYKIPIDPNTLIDEICVDPRLEDYEAKTTMENVKRMGYAGEIIQSDLYKISKINIPLM